MVSFDMHQNTSFFVKVLLLFNLFSIRNDHQSNMVSRLFICPSPDPYSRTSFLAHKTAGPHSTILLKQDFTRVFFLKNFQNISEHLFFYNTPGRLLMTLRTTHAEQL